MTQRDRANRKTHLTPRVARLLAGTALAALLLAAVPDPAVAQSQAPSWTPRSSERLVKLPATYLEKSLEHDFQESALGQALQQVEQDLALKGATLTDLKAAIAEADGPMRLELRHQFLAEKRAYLELTQSRIDMRRSQAETKQRLFEDMLRRLADREAANTPARRALIERQEAARDRLEGSTVEVDLAVFESAGTPESGYTLKYAENVAAIETLRERIRSHRMNRTIGADGEDVTKEEYVRIMLSDAGAELAVLEQEQKVVGFMAKLVALDALELSEEAMDAELPDSALPGNAGPAQAVDFFISN